MIGSINTWPIISLCFEMYEQMIAYNVVPLIKSKTKASKKFHINQTELKGYF